MRATTPGSSMTTAGAVITNARHARRSSCCPSLSQLTTASPATLITTDLQRWNWNLPAPPPPPPSLRGQGVSRQGHGQASCWEPVAKAHSSPRWYQRIELQPSPLQSSSPSRRILYRRGMLCQLPAPGLLYPPSLCLCLSRLLTQLHLTCHLFQRASAWWSPPPR